jgi:8-oxo-dGTP diphosphatase
MFRYFPESFSIYRVAFRTGSGEGCEAPHRARDGSVGVAANDAEAPLCSHLGSDTHAVVACVLTHRGLICLLRRSSSVGSDRGKWHCVTGFLPPATNPLDQARSEVCEETALDPEKLRLTREAEPLVLVGATCSWTVFPFLFEVTAPMLTLNWEHDAYRWATPRALSESETVHWLPEVCRQLELST